MSSNSLPVDPWTLDGFKAAHAADKRGLEFAGSVFKTGLVNTANK